ncbi:MAG TPA: sterol desaturase family protein [Polyangiaceae bacterium]|nr:sterol desaturase family protein [Polyangiaceae bacterium]
MDTLILYALPVFVLSMLLEFAEARRQRRHVYEARDSFASIAMGLGSMVVGVPFKLGFVWLLALVYEHRLFTVPRGAFGYLALLLCEDLCYYWSHRTNHEVRLFWAAHVNHHSSERYNLATAVRQSWTQPYLMWIFWLPLPLFGFAPELILLQQAVSLIYQFFIHTELVGKLGPLEWLFNTPSHHRVHHAVNVRYLDKNHAGIFIIWDRMFGTFAEERSDDPPRYGITKPIDSFNPLYIAFHEWRALFRDVRRAPRLIDKVRYVFAPPGFSPDGSTLTSKQLQAKLRATPSAQAAS